MKRHLVQTRSIACHSDLQRILIVLTLWLFVAFACGVTSAPGQQPVPDQLSGNSSGSKPAIMASFGDQFAQEIANPQAIGNPSVLANPDPVATAATSPTANPNANKKAAEKKKELAQKQKSAYKGVFYNNNFDYLCDPDYCGWLLGENLKKRCLPFCGNYDIGGQFRMRYQGERNIRGLGLTGVDDDFLLYRTRIYGDFQFTPDIRVYAEMLDAESNYEQFAPRPIEVNRADAQNLFIDARLWQQGDTSVLARVGRQELLYGLQRNISPLDWANTRRTFEGAMLRLTRKDVQVDAFWTNPMRISPDQFDSPDRDQEFMGLYSTYKGRKDQTIDAYLLRYLNGAGPNNFKFNTVGARWQGDKQGILWDIEAGYQFGTNTNGSDHAAGMTTFGLGKAFQDCWKTAVWMYYDWASGDQLTGAGNGWNHNFPLAHKYNGFMDLYGRRNLEDINLLCTLQPTSRLKLTAWYHYFALATKSDTPYSVVMTPFNPGNTPGSADLGHEIDLTAAYAIGPRQSLLLGYSHFFAGDYYRTTANIPYDGDADFFYTQWTLNF